MTKWCRRCQSAGEPSFPNEYRCEQSDLNLADICLGNKLQILRANFWTLWKNVKIYKIDYLEIGKIYIIKFSVFNFRMIYFTRLSLDLTCLGLESLPSQSEQAFMEENDTPQCAAFY